MGFLNFFKKKLKVETVYVETQRSLTRNKLQAAASDYLVNGFHALTQEHLSDRLSRQDLFSLPLKRMRLASRRTYWSSNVAKGTIKRLVDNTINDGLKLQSIPQWSLLPQRYRDDPDLQKSWVQNTEARFRTWAMSTDPDIKQLKNFYQLQSQAFASMLKDGEFFAILRFSRDTRLQNPLVIQLVDPNMVCEVTEKTQVDAIKARGNTTKDGIEFDKNGKPIAYFFTDQTTLKSTKIERIGARTGRIFVLHGFIPEYPSQTRGIPFLTGVIRDLQKLSDWHVADLAAAVLNASVAMSVKPSDKKAASRVFGGAQLKEKTEKQEVLEEVVRTPFGEGLFSGPGIIVQNLKAGEELQPFDTKRPNSDFDKANTGIKKDIFSSLSLPPEFVDQLFGQNFSASRGALMLAWNVINIYRADFNAMFNLPAYLMWMDREINARRITAEEWNDPVSKRAWSTSQWVGISKPSIDPFKEARAASERIRQGISTREREAQESNGTSFDENVERLKIENKDLAEANAPLQDEETNEPIDEEG